MAQTGLEHNMKTETYLYEILIRGAVDGKITGAHVIYMDRYISDDGEVLAEKPSPTAIIDITKIQDILGKELAEALTQLPQALAERDTAVADKKAAVDAFTKCHIDALDALSKLK